MSPNIRDAELTESATPRAEELGKDYLGWLDGVRALCAMYVVFHHSYIGTFPSYQDSSVPGLGWLVYGQLAVVAFIVISGYSLTLKPLQRGLELKEGPLGFYRRRCWRILPAYWAALLFAMVYHLSIQFDFTGPVALRTFIIHALLLQDIFHNSPPNGAFWSIAVEMQIYILFPLVLYFCRLVGSLAAVAIFVGSTIALHLASGHLAALAPIDHLSPQLFIAFLIGLLAARFSNKEAAKSAISRIVTALSASMTLSTLVLMPVRTVEASYFWIDIAASITIALIFVQIANNEWIKRVLGRAGLLGSISYSVYLTHLIVLHPILIFAKKQEGMSLRLSIMFLFGVPSVILVGTAFFFVFERPFLTIRSWAALRRTLIVGHNAMGKPDCEHVSRKRW